MAQAVARAAVPVVLLVVVLTRGSTDGWVPHGFLLPERGLGSLVLHVGGLLVGLLAAGALVRAASGTRGLWPRRPRATT